MLPAITTAAKRGVIDAAAREQCRALLLAVQADLAPAPGNALRYLLAATAKVCSHPEAGESRAKEIASKLRVLEAILEIPAGLLRDPDTANALLKIAVRSLRDQWFPGAQWWQAFFDEQAEELRKIHAQLSAAAALPTKGEAEAERAKHDPCMRLVLRWRSRFADLRPDIREMQQAVSLNSEELVNGWLAQAATALPQESGWNIKFMDGLERQHRRAVTAAIEAKHKAALNRESAIA